MKLTLLAVILTTFLAVRSIPVDNLQQDGNHISTKGSEVNSEENDLKPAEFFYPGIGFGFGFGHPLYHFYSKPYWHPFYGYKPYYSSYHGGHGGLGSHWHYRY